MSEMHSQKQNYGCPSKGDFSFQVFAAFGRPGESSDCVALTSEPRGSTCLHQTPFISWDLFSRLPREISANPGFGGKHFPSPPW